MRQDPPLRRRPFQIARGFPRPSVDRRRADELRQLALRMQQERRAAEPIVRAIVRIAAADPNVDLPEEWITLGVAEGLTSASAAMLDASPGVALTVASYSVTVATRLDAAYPAAFRTCAIAHAWGRIADIYNRAGHPEAALRALGHADEALGRNPALAHDRAILDVVRANALHALGRTREAQSILDAAIATFLSFGDTERARECRRLKTSLEVRADG